MSDPMVIAPILKLFGCFDEKKQKDKIDEAGNE
jgi:hypothetical protein